MYFTGSTKPTNPVNIGASALKVVSGHAISGTASANVAMVSTTMARKNGLKVGSMFTAYGKTLTVAAIFESDTQQGNDSVITSLPVLERLEAPTGQVFSATITAASLTALRGDLGDRATLGPGERGEHVADADRQWATSTASRGSRSTASPEPSGPLP